MIERPGTPSTPADKRGTAQTNPAGSARRAHVEIYTDGGCDPNPGPGGYGVVLLHPKKRVELSGGFRRTTNNRMEIFAAIRGLELLKRPCRVVLYSDSQYLVRAMMDGWVRNWRRKGWWRTKTVRPENVDLWQRLATLCETHQVEFRWLRGHAGHLENERCDQLAVTALRQPNLPPDAGYENKPVAELDRRRLTQEGQPCRKCDTPVVKQTARHKPSHGYYYDYYLWCPKCHATYEVPEARRVVAQTPSLF